MKLFNSLTNTLEEFKPIKDGEVSMYVCGPTVYNYPHVGNVRPIVVFDVLRNTLEASGYNVTYVSNFTDVDDKIIKKAIAEGSSEKEVSEYYINAYNQDRLSLHAHMPDKTPKVTENMEDIISFIKDLIDEGYAYEIEGDVYFRVEKVKDYGQLSKQKIEDLVVGARIDENDKKENPLDFTLWKQTEEGIKWDSPWSKGRPGWHTECVVMIQKEFKQPVIDIHGGGMDLKFPHHENEIAQGCAHNHNHVANYWVHNGMVNMDGEKMSKSLGNVVWAKDMIEQLGGNLMRWVLLSAHYRSPLNISDEVIESSRKELAKIETSIKQATLKLALEGYEYDGEVDETLYKPFLEALQDDINTQNAFMFMYDATKQLNALTRERVLDYKKVQTTLTALLKMLEVLGIQSDDMIIRLQESDRKLFALWNDAKQEKDFEKADKYRAQLIEKGLLS